MNKDAYWRARTILKRGEVIPYPGSSSSSFHFKVKQRGDHGWADVWYKENKHGVMEWRCGSVDPKSNSQGERWGCVMNVNVDRKEPFCSHTLAAKMYMEQKKNESKKKNS